MTRVRAIAGTSAAALATALLVTATPAFADADVVDRELYREDAFAEFSVPEGPDCPLGRTDIQVSFHQDFFTDSPAPTTRTVLFGVAISVFDCAGQFVASYAGSESFPQPFDIAQGLQSATVQTTVQACVEVPAPGECFPVDLSFIFRGIGPIDVDKQKVRVNEPDCEIEQVFVTKTRVSEVQGTVSFTPPGGAQQSLTLSTDDLSANGASLSSQFESTFMMGDGPACTEQ
jgi:hypothetical protein